MFACYIVIRFARPKSWLPEVLEQTSTSARSSRSFQAFQTHPCRFRQLRCGAWTAHSSGAGGQGVTSLGPSRNPRSVASPSDDALAVSKRRALNASTNQQPDPATLASLEAANASDYARAPGPAAYQEPILGMQDSSELVRKFVEQFDVTADWVSRASCVINNHKERLVRGGSLRWRRRWSSSSRSSRPRATSASGLTSLSSGSRNWSG